MPGWRRTGVHLHWVEVSDQSVTSYSCLHCCGCGLHSLSRKGRKRWPQLTYLSIRKEERRQIKPKGKKKAWKTSKRSNPQQQYLVCVRSQIWSKWMNPTFNKCGLFSFLSALQLGNGTRTWPIAVLIQQLTPSPPEFWQRGPYYRAPRSELPGEGSCKSHPQTPCG